MSVVIEISWVDINDTVHPWFDDVSCIWVQVIQIGDYLVDVGKSIACVVDQL
jgi:hypothetical protein